MAGNGVDESKCPVCSGSTNGATICCNNCLYWFHYKCVGVKPEDPWVKNEDWPYYCPNCRNDPSIKKSNYADLADIMTAHQNSNDFPRQLRTNEDEKPISCKFCEKKFSDNAKLKEHETIHIGEKPHSCIFCNKKFRLQSVLKQHEKTHTGEKPYSCQFC